MTRMKVIVDTDILSMFAKVGAVDVLEGFLGKGRVAMTPAIRDEISIPMEYGYTFPGEVLSRIPVVPLTAQVLEEYERSWTTMGYSLGKGELEAIAFCRVAGALFATNDSAAREFAQDQNVQVVSLASYPARAVAEWDGMRSKAEVRELLERIKKADYLEVPPEVEVEIFEDQ